MCNEALYVTGTLNIADISEVCYESHNWSDWLCIGPEKQIFFVISLLLMKDIEKHIYLKDVNFIIST